MLLGHDDDDGEVEVSAANQEDLTWQKVEVTV